jgi:hypothetical protein
MTASHRMNIEHLPVGIYFIQIGNYSEKFMVVKCTIKPEIIFLNFWRYFLTIANN